MNSTEKFIGFDKIKDTVFLKNFTKDNENLNKLSRLYNISKDLNTKKLIQKDISLIKWGLEGENNVYFELKNSFLPMICMHDIRIEVEGLFAQIDFLILTNKFIYIFETKHLVGDIKINNSGDFIRIFKDESNATKEEGMYNPVTQGNRHARLLKKFLENRNLINIEDFPIKSIAILANPKTIINKDYAPKHIKENIYKYDQIVHFLQEEFSNEEYDIMISDNKLNHIANSILKEHTPICYDYESKYGIKISDYTTTNNRFNNNEAPILNEEDLKNNIEKKLRNIRKIKSKELNIKAYELFTNKQLELILSHMPKTLLELNKLNILTKKASALIGKNIVDTINKYNLLSPNSISSKHDDIQTDLKDKLIKYRENKAKILNTKDYMIFTNYQLDEIVLYNPKSIKELNNIKGLNPQHINDYGNEILSIINQNTKKHYV